MDRFIPGEKITLRGELKIPGQAWLDFRIRPSKTEAVIEKTVVYASKGVRGLIYWYAVRRLHALVFDGMLRNMASAAENPRLSPPPNTRESADSL